MSQIYKNGGGGPAPDIETLTGDSGGAVPPTGGNINVLGQPDINVAGNPGTSTLTWTDLTKITPYTVDGSLTAGTEVAYSTIQSAINAASAAGGGVVYIRPGQYTENLTLLDNVDLYATPAVSQNQGQTVTIIGTHTPPATGHIGFNSICFVSTTDVFLSAAAGSTHIVFLNCESAVQNGYFLNLPNWTGILEIFDFNPSTAGAPFAVQDGGINNTGGATLFMFDAGLGFGTANTMNLSGLIVCQGTSFDCPTNFQTGSNISIDDHVFNGAVTFSGNSTGDMNNCRFSGDSSSAITMNSSASININQCVLDSSNANVVAGSGAGNLVLLNNTFVDNQQIGASVITPNLNHVIRGNGSTVGAVTTDIITYTLPSVICTVTFDITVSAIESTNPASAGYEIFGSILTNGVAASLIDVPDKIVHESAAVGDAQCDLIVSGNNAILRVTGVAGLTMRWNAFTEFTQVR